jgi:hypothetical protein
MGNKTLARAVRPEASMSVGAHGAVLQLKRGHSHALDQAIDSRQHAPASPGISLAPANPNAGHHFAHIPVRPPLRFPIQAKLAVSEPDDKYEQEADRVANVVMRMPEPILQRRAACPECASVAGEVAEEVIQSKPLTITPLIQREAGDSRTEEDNAGEEEDTTVHAKEAAGPSPALGAGLEARIMGLKGGGQPLDPATRGFMEPRFGHDFSRVRVHSGATAEQSAREVNANAYTVGQDIVFGAGQFAPGTRNGRGLLAHELTHVVQHGAGSLAAAVQRQQASAVAQPRVVKDRVQFFSNVERSVQFDLMLEIAGAPADDNAEFAEFVDAAREGVIQAVTQSLGKVPASVRIALRYRVLAGPEPRYGPVTEEARLQVIRRYGEKDAAITPDPKTLPISELAAFKKVFWEAMLQDPPDRDRVRRYLDALDRRKVPTGPIDQWATTARHALLRERLAVMRAKSLEEQWSVRIVTRKEWGARAPDKTKGWDEYPPGKPLPLTRIIVHHTAGKSGSQGLSAKELQEEEFKKGYADVPYHFIITRDGTIHEGRQINVVGAHAGAIEGNKDITKDPDWGSIGIVVVGNFDHPGLASKEYPTPQQLESLQNLLNHLTQQYKIDPRQIQKHKEVVRGGEVTVCPGQELSPKVDEAREMSLKAYVEFEAAAQEVEAAQAEVKRLKASD